MKLVIFFSFWQSMIIEALFHFKYITRKASWGSYTENDVANGMQEFLLCVEMLIASIAHAYAFPVSDFAPPPGVARPTFGAGVREMLSCGDVIADVGIMVGCVLPLAVDLDSTERGTPAADLEKAAAAGTPSSCAQLELAKMSASAGAGGGGDKQARQKGRKTAPAEVSVVVPDAAPEGNGAPHSRTSSQLEESHSLHRLEATVAPYTPTAQL